MDSDVLLTRVLSLASSLDGAIEEASGVDEDTVYELVGLVMELDVWLSGGHRLPSRWARAKGRESAALFMLTSEAPGNDAPPRTRRSLVRTRRTRASSAQLAFAFCAAET